MNRMNLSQVQRQLNEFGYSKKEVETYINDMIDKRDEAKAMADDSGYDYEGDEE